MAHTLLGQLGFILSLVVCAFALLRGAAAERFAAFLISLTWVSGIVVSTFLGRTISSLVLQYIFLGQDCIVAIGLLLVALRYAQIWLGVAMLLQSLELALNGAQMADFGLSFNTYMWFNNTVSYSLLAILFGATVNVTLQRRRASADADEGSHATPWVTPTPAHPSETPAH